MTKPITSQSSVHVDSAAQPGGQGSERAATRPTEPSVAWGPASLLIDGVPTRLLSGAVHYFRTFPQDWRDRLEKLRDLGCNAVETYVPWNLHEPAKGHYRFDGRCDLDTFLDLAEDLDLYAIVRPGPYICAEWDFGGLPWWLLAEDGAKVRCGDPAFLRHVDDWWRVLIPRLARRQHARGGPIIAVQVENEYGYFGADAEYLAHLKRSLVALGIDVPLFTSDSPDDVAQTLGGVPGVLRTGNFGGDVDEKLDVLARHVDAGPSRVHGILDRLVRHLGQRAGAARATPPTPPPALTPCSAAEAAASSSATAGTTERVVFG